MEEVNEFGDVVQVPNMVETALEWVKDGYVRIRYIPLRSKKAEIIYVTEYDVDGLSDRVGRDVGFFKDENDVVIAIHNPSIKWIELYEYT